MTKVRRPTRVAEAANELTARRRPDVKGIVQAPVELL